MTTREEGGELVLALVIGVAIAMAITLSACTKAVPYEVIQTKVQVVRVEVPTPVLQRCLAPDMPQPPMVQPYKCKKEHLCLDKPNTAKLAQMFGILIAHIVWLETHCTEQSKEEIIKGSATEELEEKGPML